MPTCCNCSANKGHLSGPDPGFPVGGRGPILGRFWPLIWALFGENVCENERIGSCKGRALARPLDPPMLMHFTFRFYILLIYHYTCGVPGFGNNTAWEIGE